MMNADDLNKLLLAAIQGLDIEFSGVEVSEESIAAFEEIKSQLEEAPQGSMAYVPWDYADSDKWDWLIEATERAYGKPKIYDEISAGEPSEQKVNEEEENENE